MTGGTGPDILDSGGGSWWREQGPAQPADPPKGRRDTAAHEPATRSGGPLPEGVDAPVAPGPNGPGGGRWRRGLRLAVAGVLLLAGGAAAGAAYADRRAVQRAEAAANSAVELRYDEEGLTRLTADGPLAHWGAEVWLTNSGARPVRLLDARLVSPGWSTDPFVGTVTIPADDGAVVHITGSIDCGAVDAFARNYAIDLRVVTRVRTQDGAEREVDLGRVPRQSVLRQAPTACDRRTQVDVRDLAAILDGDRVRGRVIVFLSGGLGARLEDMVLEPPSGFSTSTTNLPQRISGNAAGQVGIDVRVVDCDRALGFDPDEVTLEVLATGASTDRLTAPVPPRLGTALVRLSERTCGR